MKEILSHTGSREGVIDLLKIGALLGTGGFAAVYQAENLRTSQKYAVKVVDKRALTDLSQRERLKEEIRIHRRLKHKNIVQFKGLIEDEECVYIVMELCENQSLKDIQRTRSRLTELEVKYYLRQMICALEYLHGNRILHRDLKLGNFFLDSNMQLKLGDFGLATRLKVEGELRLTRCGTPNYIAPEILEEKGHSYEVDIWALGAVAYTLLVGKPPFECQTVDETYTSIRKAQFKFPLSIPLSCLAKDFIERLLRENPSERPGLKEIKGHPFVSNKMSLFPTTLPTSLLVEPPSSQLMKLYGAEDFQLKITLVPRKLHRSSSKRDLDIPLFDHLEQKLKRCCSHHSRQSLISPQMIELNSRQTLIQSSVKRSGSRFQGAPSSTTLAEKQELVIDYVDWSSKFGIGYILSSGTTGFLFNDKTSLTKFSNRLTYRGRSGDPLTFPWASNEAPRNLQKKSQILRQSEDILERAKVHNGWASRVIALRFLRHESGVLVIKLSNSSCQFLWKDCSVLLKEYKSVVWRSKDGQMETGTLTEPPDCQGVSQKMQEIRAILQQFTCFDRK